MSFILITVYLEVMYKVRHFVNLQTIENTLYWSIKFANKKQEVQVTKEHIVTYTNNLAHIGEFLLQ